MSKISRPTKTVELLTTASNTIVSELLAQATSVASAHLRESVFMVDAPIDFGSIAPMYAHKNSIALSLLRQGPLRHEKFYGPNTLPVAGFAFHFIYEALTLEVVHLVPTKEYWEFNVATSTRLPFRIADTQYYRRPILLTLVNVLRFNEDVRDGVRYESPELRGSRWPNVARGLFPTCAFPFLRDNATLGCAWESSDALLYIQRYENMWDPHSSDATLGRRRMVNISDFIRRMVTA